MIKQHGGKNIKFMCIIAAPEGLERLHKEHPDVQIYVGALDRQLNENAYICPGLGDAGDRILEQSNQESDVKGDALLQGILLSYSNEKRKEYGKKYCFDRYAWGGQKYFRRYSCKSIKL